MHFGWHPLGILGSGHFDRQLTGAKGCEGIKVRLAVGVSKAVVRVILGTKVCLFRVPVPLGYMSRNRHITGQEGINVCFHDIQRLSEFHKVFVESLFQVIRSELRCQLRVISRCFINHIRVASTKNCPRINGIRWTKVRSETNFNSIFILWSFHHGLFFCHGHLIGIWVAGQGVPFVV